MKLTIMGTSEDEFLVHGTLDKATIGALIAERGVEVVKDVVVKAQVHAVKRPDGTYFPRTSKNAITEDNLDQS